MTDEEDLKEGSRKVFGLHDRGIDANGNKESTSEEAEDLVTEVGRQLTRFLDESEQSFDGFFRGVRKSADHALEIADDHRLQSFVVVLLAGAAVGAFAAGALVRRGRAARAA